jgi:hypothetical protein
LEIADLTEFPPNHPPSPYNFPVSIKQGDTWGSGSLPEGLSLVAVGWLGATVPSTGEVDGEIIDALIKAYESKAIFSDGSAGWHDCELCPGPETWYPDGQIGPVITWSGRDLRLYGHGHHLLRHGSKVYVVPALILHYIIDHGYCPPDEFLEAVTVGEFLRSEHLNWEAI